MSNIVTSTVLIAVAILAAFFYVVPEYSELRDKRESRTEYIESIKTVSSVQEKYERAQKWRSSITQDDLSRIDVLIPKEFNNVQFLLNLNQMAAAHGVNIGPVTIDSPPEESSVVIHNVSFIFEAQYGGSVDDFLANLESSLVLFDVNSLNMEGKEDGMVRYSLSFNTYSQK